MKAVKKLTASVLCAAMLASLGGCAFFDSDDEAVLEAADAYASAVVKGKVKKILDLMLNGEEVEDDLEYYLSGSSADNDKYYEMVDIIADSLSYEIDEDSVFSSRKNEEASVNITYTMIDYQSIYEQISEDGGSVSDYIDAISDRNAATTEVSQTIDFVYAYDMWLVDDTNGRKIFSVYGFYDAVAHMDFIEPLLDYVDGIVWYYSDDGVYYNYSQIELDIMTTTDGMEVPFEFTYEYYRDGELIFTSDICTDVGYYIEAYYGPDYDDNAELNEDGYLVSGEYRCVMYDLAGNVLADSTCTVSSEHIDINEDIIDRIEWYFSWDDVYTNVDQIELDIIPTDPGQSVTWEFTYEYYRDGELIFTSDVCTDQGYWIEAYYGPDYDPNAELNRYGNLVGGEYRCVMYNLDGEVLADSTCTVRED